MRTRGALSNTAVTHATVALQSLQKHRKGPMVPASLLGLWPMCLAYASDQMQQCGNINRRFIYFSKCTAFAEDGQVSYCLWWQKKSAPVGVNTGNPKSSAVECTGEFCFHRLRFSQKPCYHLGVNSNFMFLLKTVEVQIRLDRVLTVIIIFRPVGAGGLDMTAMMSKVESGKSWEADVKYFTS
jgi:hypothetical protein